MKQIVKERPYYAISGLTVSEDGLTIKRQYKTTPGYPDYPKKLAIQTDQNGCLYIKADGKKHYVDVLVATCFCHKPDGANAVQHVDGNLANCHKTNLRWIAKDNPDGSRSIGNGFAVKRDGTVLKDGRAVNTIDYIYDPDLGAHRAVDDRYIDEKSKQHPIDETIATAYIPKPTGIKNPKVLHKDHNYKNSNADNLQWVDQYSTEYQEYWKDRQKDIDKRNKELEEEFGGH